MTLIEVLRKAVAEENQVYNMMIRVNKESGMGVPRKLDWVTEAEAAIKEYDADRDFEKDIADIILELKRSPILISEQEYNEWYCRLVAITERQWYKANEKASEITERCIKQYKDALGDFLRANDSNEIWQLQKEYSNLK